MRPWYCVALTQSRIRSRVGSSHPCHMILCNCLPPLIQTVIILFVIGVVGISSSFYSSSSLLSLYHPYLFLIISTLGNAVYSRRLRAYCCVHWEWRAQILICFGSHNNYSGSCWVLTDILGWRMAGWARFSRNQGPAHCQETSRRDTANKRSLELCASIVLIF